MHFKKNTSNLSNLPTGIFRVNENKQWNKQQQIVITKTGVEVNESLHKDANHALWTAIQIEVELQKDAS